MATTFVTQILLSTVENTASNETTLSSRRPFDDVTVAAVAGLLISFMIIGFFGNLLTICVILTSSKLRYLVGVLSSFRNIFNQFILSLCFSDLTSACISWVNLYRRTWGFDDFAPPNFFCWFYWGADICTSYVTAMHILSFAILRLISVWKPFVFTQISVVHGRIWILVMWVIGFTCGFIPFAYISGASTPDRSDLSGVTARWPACTQKLETIRHYKLMIHIAYPLFLYAPCVGILLMSIAITSVLLSKRLEKTKKRTVSVVSGAWKQDREAKKERQAILQLILIVGSFMIGYIPFTIFEFWTVGNTDKSFAGWQKEWMFGTVQYIFMRLSECLNPIFYNLASAKMRSETVHFLKRKLCRCCFPAKVLSRNNTSSVMSHTGLQL